MPIWHNFTSLKITSNQWLRVKHSSAYSNACDAATKAYHDTFLSSLKQRSANLKTRLQFELFFKKVFKDLRYRSKENETEIEIDRQHFNVKTFQCLMEILQSVFVGTNWTSLCNVWWRDTHANEFIGVWQSSQRRLQLNCQLNVKITKHSNAMKLKTADSIAVVVTPLLLLLQYWMTKWRTFIKLYLLENGAELRLFAFIFIDHWATLKRFNECIFIIKSHRCKSFTIRFELHA